MENGLISFLLEMIMLGFSLVCRSDLNDSSLASMANIGYYPAYLMLSDIHIHLSFFQTSMLKTHLQMCVGGKMLWC